MPYPRQLVLDEDTEERLISYLNTELENFYAERGRFIDDLNRWQQIYWAQPSTELAEFPFKGAATIEIPLSAIAVETVHARNITTVFAVKELVSAQAKAPDWSDSARPFERFFDHELKYGINFRQYVVDTDLERVKYGTCVGKMGYERLVKKAVITLPNGEETTFDVVTKQGACMDAVPISRFLMPFYARDPENSPWVGEEHEKTAYDVINLEYGGLFKEGTRDNLEKWIADSQQNPDKFKQQQQDLDNIKPVWPKTIQWKEIWLAFDVDGDGRDEEIVVHYHKESRTLMSVRYNWYADLSRPYEIGIYFPVEHRWTGMGVCKQSEHFQREITTQHRQRLDNATLANMRMIKVSSLSKYGPNEPIWPGKMWFVDNMDHIDSFQLAEIYPSSFADEQGSLIYLQQRTGVNEVMLGMPQVGTPGTATSDLSRIQEGQKKSDYHYGNFKDFLDRSIKKTAVNIHIFGPRTVEYFEYVDVEGQVAKLFNMPERLVSNGLLLELKTTGQQQNKLLDRQNWLQIAPVFQQYLTGMLSLAQLTGNAQLAALIAQKGMSGATEIMVQILETFDVRNVDRIILRELIQAVTGNGNGLNQISQSGGSQGLILPGQNGGMGAINQAIPTFASPSYAGNGRV